MNRKFTDLVTLLVIVISMIGMLMTFYGKLVDDTAMATLGCIITAGFSVSFYLIVFGFIAIDELYKAIKNEKIEPKRIEVIEVIDFNIISIEELEENSLLDYDKIASLSQKDCYYYLREAQ